MRTTVNLPEDVYRIARSMASAKSISLGEALAELIRRGLQPPAAEVNQTAGFPRFFARKDARPITLERTLKAEDQP